MSSLNTAVRLMRSMNLRDLRALDSRLHDRIAEEEPPEAEPKSKREVVPGSKRTSGG